MFPVLSSFQTVRTRRFPSRSRFEAVDIRVWTALWLFGVINGVVYYIILSAAPDLVGPNFPKGMVLVNIWPCFMVKLLALPLKSHKVPHEIRVVTFALLSTSGMLLIVFTGDSKGSRDISTEMVGVALAGLGGGGGELSFLSLTHFYGRLSLASWGSGSGASGLIGAGAYGVATTWLGFSIKSILLLFSLLPVIMFVTFFVVLPRGAQAPKARSHVRSTRLLGEEASAQVELSRGHF